MPFRAKQFWEDISSTRGAITPGGNQWRDELVGDIIFNLLDWIPTAQKRAANLLDVGCGEGRLMKGLASGVRLYTGVDISKNALITAKENAKKFGLFNCEFVEILDEDIDNLGDFEIVVSFSVFMHLPVLTLIRYFNAVYGCLSSGGYFAFQIPGQEHFAGDEKHLKENRFDVLDDDKRFETRWYPDYLIASYLTLAGFHIVGTPSESSLTWKCRKF